MLRKVFALFRTREVGRSAWNPPIHWLDRQRSSHNEGWIK